MRTQSPRRLTPIADGTKEHRGVPCRAPSLGRSVMHDRRPLLLLLVTGVFSSCAPRPSLSRPGEGPAARVAIDTQLAKLFDAYRQRDGAAFAALYAEGAVMTSPQGTLTGRAAIRVGHERRARLGCCSNR